MRGSRKHVLDLITDRPTELGALVRDVDFVLSEPLIVRPASRAQPSEYTLRQFCKEFLPGWPGFPAFDRAWVPEEYKNPTWDLLALGMQAGRPALLLVEAKAHEGELDRKGKQLADTASEQSRRNHSVIGRSIADAATGLSKIAGQPFGICAQTHYQLSNRIASAYALAVAGLPAVLLYLGFIGDTYFSDYLANDEQWQAAMRGYVKNIVSVDVVGKRLSAGAGWMTMAVKSLPVHNVSTREEAAPV